MSALIAEWRSFADAGDADAKFNMGQAYRLGRGVPTDIDAAITWFGRAAAQGHARPRTIMACCCSSRVGAADAMPYLERSAARGEALAQYILGTASVQRRECAEGLGPRLCDDDPRRRVGPGTGTHQSCADGQLYCHRPVSKGTALAATMEKQEQRDRVGPPPQPLPSRPAIERAEPCTQHRIAAVQRHRPPAARCRARNVTPRNRGVMPRRFPRCQRSQFMNRCGKPAPTVAAARTGRQIARSTGRLQ